MVTHLCFFASLLLASVEVLSQRSHNSSTCECRGNIDTLTLRYVGRNTRTIEVMTDANTIEEMELLLEVQDLLPQQTLRLESHDGAPYLGTKCEIYDGSELLAAFALDCSTLEVSLGNLIAERFFVLEATTTEGGSVCEFSQFSQFSKESAARWRAHFDSSHLGALPLTGVVFASMSTLFALCALFVFSRGYRDRENSKDICVRGSNYRAYQEVDESASSQL